MAITRETAAKQLASYLHHELTLKHLVDWAEDAFMEEDLEEEDAQILRTVLGRIGVSDIREFGLTWEDCEELLNQLGYTVRVEIAVA